MAPPALKKREHRRPNRRRRSEPRPVPKHVLFGHEINFKTIVWVASTMTVFLVAVITYNTAHPIIEPGMPALRGYVREHSVESTTKAIKPIVDWKSTWESDYGAWRAIQSAATERNTLVNLEQNLASARSEKVHNPQSSIINERIQELENQIKRTKTRIQDYEAAALKK